ncbi:ROK family protein [Georgenia phoenicis]|uniref:ROK family protein n=1 Tax=unclassified Georgenia TaxID=2626815 RepID=UPI0039AF1F34
MSDIVVGVDLGGTKTAAAMVSADGALGPVRSVPTPAKLGPDAVLDAVAGLVREVVAHGGPLTAPDGTELGGPVTVRGVGVGSAGVVDTTTGTILSATDSFLGWPGTDVRGGLRARLADVLGAGPVTVENDVDAHAGGEVWLGAAAGADSALMVAVGTGVGASVVLGGRPLRGAHHVAGEMGHQPSPDAAGLPCGCGRPGHLEALGSGPALHRHYLRLGGDAAVADTREVCARAAAGDELAARAVRESARAVGRSVAGVVTVLDPAVVVLGGGMSQAGPLWWEPMEAALREELIEPLADIPVRPSALGPVAAVLGAARTAIDVRA